MTSSSDCERSSGRAPGWVVAVVLAVAATGCVDEQVVETQALVFAESRRCEMAAAAGDTVNAYRVVLYEFGGSDPDSTMPPCVSCLTEGRCRPVSVVCGCGPDTPPQTVPLNGQVGGLRFAGLDPGRRYCIAAAAFDVPGPSVPPSRRAQVCSCEHEGVDLADVVRLCGVTPFPGVVDENAPAIVLPVECSPDCPVFRVPGT